MSDTTPNPGSREAVRAGCTCPAMDNHYGRGRGTDPDTDERLFWFTSGCPVHAPRTGTNAPERVLIVEGDDA